jgi:glutathione S-transferase
MYQLFIANKNYSSWSLRPWVLMRELHIPFNEKLIPFSSDNNWKEFRQFSPVGKVPCLHDGDSIVWDSLAIIEFLADRHTQVWPNDPKAKIWARCASAEMHSGFSTLRKICTMNVGLRIGLHQISPQLQADFDRLNELLNEGLQQFGGPYLAGNTFTGVDAFYAPVIFRIQTYGLRMQELVDQYAQRILNLASMQEWQNEALKEIWRESAHENEALSIGTVIQDYRFK